MASSSGGFVATMKVTLVNDFHMFCREFLLEVLVYDFNSIHSKIKVFLGLSSFIQEACSEDLYLANL